MFYVTAANADIGRSDIILWCLNKYLCQRLATFKQYQMIQATSNCKFFNKKNVNCFDKVSTSHDAKLLIQRLPSISV